MKQTQKSVIALTSSAALLLALSACSSSGTGSENGSGGSKSLTLGVSVPLSGAAAAAGFGQDCGIKAYFAAANASGGINGYQVNVKDVDHQNDTPTAATIARDLAMEGSFAVVVAGTGATEASRPALQAAGVPLFGTGDGAAFAPPKASTEYGFTPRYQDELSGAVHFIVNTLGEKKISFVNMGGGAGAATTAAFPEIISSAGAEAGLLESIPGSTNDFGPFAQKLKEANAPVVHAQIPDTMISGLQKAADAIGYNPKWVLFPIAYGPTYLNLAGKLSEGVYVSQWSEPSTQTENTAVQKFVDDVKSLGGECAKQTTETNVSLGYGIASIIGYAIQEATKDGGTLDAESLTGALKFSDKSIGTTPSLTYSDESHAAITASSYWQVTSGTLKKVADWAPLTK